MIEVTKQNINEKIENYLKEEKIRYNINFQDSIYCIYELFLGSESGYIQVEYDIDNDTDDYIVAQLYSGTYDKEQSIYHYYWDNQSEDHGSIEINIEALVEEVKKINKAIYKIKSKIEDIREICEEYELEFEEFIEIKYNFE